MSRDRERESVASLGVGQTQPVGASGLIELPGTVIASRYRVVEWLGRGGMGSVYAVDDVVLSTRVALKMAEGASWSSDVVAQLKREIMLARRVTHPSVCRVHDFGLHVLPDASARPFLTMELLPGETLSAELARVGRMEPDRVLRLASQMATALDAAHAAGVVHRDFKTGNVMVVGERAIVTDFGLAVDVASGGVESLGTFVGSPAYMAPEQVRGGRVTRASDVYAFGIVLFELLTGRLPFHGATPTALATSRLHERPAALFEHRKDLDPRWERAILRCLQLDPEQRFASCGEALQAIAGEAPAVLVERPTLPPAGSERRALALVLVDGIRDARAVARAVERHGGVALAPSPERQVALFGAHHSLGDEIDRALAVATAVRRSAARVAVAVGHGALRDGVLTGDAIEEAEAVVAHGREGLLAGPHSAAVLGLRCDTTELAPGLFAIGASRPSASTMLVGRETELSMLRRARDAVLDERRLLASWVVGPPGTGKSRLLEAAVQLADEAGMAVHAGRALSSGARAFSLFGGADAPADMASTYEGLTQSLGRRTDAQALSDRARAEVLARLADLGRGGPLALILDDVQWADGASLALLEELPAHLGEAPVWLVLGARDELLEARPELVATFDSAGRIEQSPLRASGVAELVWMRTGRDPMTAVVQALADRTGGNPLFVEQLLAVLEPRALEGELDGEWPLPATIEHAVQARLDQLPPAERDGIALLAIFGRPTSASELAALGLGAARTTLASLLRRSLVARVPGGDVERYRLRNALVAEVAYRLLDEEPRRALHHRAAVLAESSGRDSEEVARHRAASGDAEGALPFYARATLEHAARGDSPGVLRCATRALALGLGDDHAFGVHVACAEAARFLGDGPRERHHLDEASRCARTPRERALAASEDGEWLRRARRLDQALERLTEAVGLAQASGDVDTHARAMVRRVATLVTLGRTREAAEALDAIDALSGSSIATRAIVEDVRGYLAGTTGDNAGQRAAYARAAALYSEAGDLRRAAGAASNLANAGNRLGRYDEAQGALRAAVALARKVGNPITEGYALLNLGHALGELGRLDEARTTLEQSLRLARTLGDGYLERAARVYAARVRLAGGADRALATELDALAAEASGDATLEAAARTLAARAWLAVGDLVQACAAAEAALRVRAAHGALEEGEGELFWAAAQVFEAAGRSEDAERAWADGRARVLELAACIGDSDDRASFLSRIPAHGALTGDCARLERAGS
jgi:tetratricopeptide (TPR) repeat protein